MRLSKNAHLSATLKDYIINELTFSYLITELTTSQKGIPHTPLPLIPPVSLE
jgi:hypothetical protein